MVRPLARFPDRFSLRSGGAPTEGGQRRSGAGRGSAKERRAGRRSLGLELLESRQLLAVTASLVGADLQVTLGAADDQAFLSSDGSYYIVDGTGLAAEQFDLAKVDSINVADAGAFANQSFTVEAGSPIVDRLVVDQSVEITTISGVLDIGTTDPGLSIGSPVISLAADVTTQGGGQVYGGAVTIAGSLTLTSDAGAVDFQDTVDSYSGVSFAPRAEFAAGVSPDSVSIGDINGDGLQDLAIANGSSSSVSVLLNTTPSGATTPSYAAQATFATGSGPASVSIGDFNGDGQPDLAIANVDSNSVSVLLNTTVSGATKPSFVPQVEFATGKSPRSVSIGDFNGDGKPDLAIANYDSNSVSVLLNTTAPGDPTPSFAPQVEFATGIFPDSVSVGDFDGDGKPDLAIANAGSDSVSVLLNTTALGDPTPSFAPQVEFATGGNPASVSVGDINGDAQPDLAIANSFSGTVSVLLNTTAPGDPTPSFAPQAEFATGGGPRSVAIGDLNGDGKPDLAIANSYFGTVSVLLNTTAMGAATPSFAPQAEFVAGSSPQSVAIGDLNDDGSLDLAFANADEGSSSVSVLLNTTQPGSLTVSSSSGTTFKKSVGGISPLLSLDVVAGTTSLWAGVTTTLTQTYSDAVTLAADTMLTGTTITTNSTVDGGSRALTITGDAVVQGAISGVTDYSVSGTTDLGADVTTTGAQTYTGLVTLAADATLTGTDPTFTAGVIGKGKSLALDFSGTSAIDGALFKDLKNLSTGNGGTTTLTGAITTTGTQTYSDKVTLLADTTLTGTTIETESTLDGGSRALAITGDAVVKGAISGVTDYSMSGTTDLGADVTTTGAQTFTGLVTLAADATLTGTDPTFTAGVAGKGKSLTLDFSGTTAIDGALFTDIKNLSTGNGGTTTLTGAIETTGTQTYADAVKLLGDTTLKGTRIANGSTLDGAAHSLTITGDAVVQGAISGGTDFAVSGTTDLGSDVTTTGAQTYTGLVTLAADATLTGTDPTFTAGVDGKGKSLALNFSGTTAIDGALFKDLKNLSTGNGGTTTLTGAITTTGTQTYADAVKLLGDTTLKGTTITNVSTLDGAAHSLTITGDAVVQGAIGGVTDFAVSGTTDLGADVTTTGAQTYTGLVTLAGDATLTGTDPTFTAGVDGKGKSLALDFSGTSAIDGALFKDLKNLSTGNGGTTTLTGAITTTGTQTYSDAVTLLGDTTLKGTTIETGSTVDGGSKALTVTGDAVVQGAIGGVTDFAVSGTTDLGADVTTTGTQTYTGLVTLAADATLTGTDPTFTAGVAGKGKSLAINFSGTTAIDGALFTGIKNLSTGNGGTTTLTGAITTTGTQTYADAVKLLGDTTLKGTTITNESTLAGAAHSLTITGDAVVKGAIGGVTTYSVSGTTNLGADVTTTGTQTYTGAVTLTVDTTLTGTTITNESTIDGAGQALAITGNAVVKGAISGVTNYSVSGTTSLGANVTTTSTQSFGGDVVLTKSVTLESTGGKDVTFGKAITSAAGLANTLTVTTSGTTTLTGNVGGALGGAAALGSLAIPGGEIVIKSSLINTSASAGQTYGGNVRFAVDAWLNSGTAATAAPVTFQKGVDSFAAGAPVNLAVNASGRTLFGGVVGGTNPLNNLWTNPGFGRADTGVTRFDATITPPQAAVRTVGSQVYGDDVVLGKNVVLVSTGNAGISFGRTLNSAAGVASTLEIVTAGTTTFDGNVGGALGGAAVLGALKTGTGPTMIRSALVNTSGADGQVYRGSVLLVADVWINSGNAATAGLVTFSSSVSSQSVAAAPFNLAVNASGPTTFAGVVGGVKPLRPLRNLWTNPGYGRTDAGLTLFTGVPAPGRPTVLTLGSQTYADDVRLAQDTLFQSSAGGGVTFSKTVQASAAPAALAIDTTGTTTFNGAVGGTIGGGAVLRSLDVKTGPTLLAAALVNTNGLGGQNYTGPVTLKASPWIEAGAGPVTFRSTLDSLPGAPTSLAINASGDTRFAGPVGKSGPLSSLSTAAGTGQSAAGTTYVDGGLVATVGDGGQSYLDRVVLGADTSFTSGPKGAIVFHDTLDGAARATFSAGGGALILFQKVGGAEPLRGISIASASSVYAARSVVLEGTNKAAAQDGLVIGAGVNSVTIAAAGNSVAGFRGTGIVLAGGSTNSLLSGFDVTNSGADGIAIRAGDYFRTRLQGNSISGSARDGLILDPAGGTLTNLLFGGGAASQGNSVSDNRANGIETTAGSLSGVTIAGNTIARNGDRVGHTGNGILVRGSNLLIGWDTAPFPTLPAPAPSNTITENGLNGIEIAAGTGNSILSNAIYNNGAATDSGAIGKGISLGVTKSGNDGQVAPEIRKVVWDRASDTVRVEVLVPADGQYFVQFFRNLPEDERGVPPVDRFGFEGRNLVAPGRATAQPVSAGKPALSGNGVIVGNSLATFEIPGASLAAGDWLTATATKLAATTPGSTSEFSKGVQVVAYPALAVGGDSFGTTWNPEYAYTPSPTVPGSVRVSNLTPTQFNVLQSLGTELTFTSTATSADVVPAKIKDAKPVVGLAGALDIQLDAPLPWPSGIFVLGWSSLPAARLYDTSTASVIRDIGRTEITAALSLPIPGPTATPTTIPVADRNAFVARFQGGIRVASADFDGDGYVDIVTVPGGAAVVAGTPVPGANPPTAAEFGDTLRVVTIFNGNPNAAARAWESASFNVGGMFNANFSQTDAGTYAGGFIVTTGDVLAESSGIRNAVTELIVASTATASPRRVVVLDVTVGARGERPVIVATQDRFDVAAPITGLATGAFTNPRGRADILVATTAGKPSDWQSQSPIANTAAVAIYAPPVSRDPATNGFQSGPVKQFFINSFMENGPPGTGFVQNAFLYGATLAVGDIDDDVRGLPELVLGAGRMGLSNFRAIPYDAVVSGSQSGIDRELSKTGTFSMPNPRPGRATGWQPGALGGPDFYAGENVPMPFGVGLNAQLDVAVVEPNGRNFRAEVFAALGGANQTGNEIRAFNWAGSNTWRKEMALTLKVVEMDRNRLHDGEGLRLG